MGMHLRALIFLLICLGSCSEAKADQTVHPASSIPAGLKIHHWSIEEGAPSRINSIAQSTDGFIWIGGVDGIFRFDGVSFEKMLPAGFTDRSLVVSDLLGAKDGAVWVGFLSFQKNNYWVRGKREFQQN